MSSSDTPIVIVKPSTGWVSLKLDELWEYRELLYFLTWRDIKVRYKLTVLGAAWAIIQPFFTMVVFSLFFGKLAKVPSDGIPYPIFAYAALVPWTFFANGLNNSSNSLVGSANTKHPLFPELSSMVRKITGIDQLANLVIERLSNLEEVYLTGDYANGMDTGIVDVILIGDINREQMDDIIMKTERYIQRKIRPLVLDRKEFGALNKRGSLGPTMKLWKKP
ncbi:MAG: ABC transporter permease [Deltaproteobacteria bacterium]|nr:ABC transporter permease [Deltaproteobacteria bacterium]